MDYDSFIQEYYGNAAAQKKDDVLRFLQRIGTSVTDEGWASALQDKSFLCKTFYLQLGGNSISRSHYQKIKEYLSNLLAYYSVSTDIIPTRDEVLESKKTIGYFKDLDHLLFFIDKVGSNILADYNKHRDLVMLKSIVILGWYGLSPKEISLINKCDLVYDEPCKVYKDAYSFIEIPQEYFLILMDLEALTEYHGLPTGKIQVLKGDEDKLFRPSREGSEGFDEGSIIQVIKRFNQVIPSIDNTSISFRSLWKNAMFVAIYEDKSEIPLLKKIANHMCCDKHGALNYRDQYCQWLQQYHDKE